MVSIYHKALGLPPDAESWAWKNNGEGFNEVAEKCAELVTRSPMIGAALARRYPVVICDEHQDCSAEQHAMLMALHQGGAKARIFADPMQRIFRRKSAKEGKADAERWEKLKKDGSHAELETPHRWLNGGSAELGEWIMKARQSRKNGEPVVVPAKRPARLSIIIGDNNARSRTGFSLNPTQRKIVDGAMFAGDQTLVLTASNEMVGSLTAYTNRRIGVWEGHTRDHLATLVEALQVAIGNAEAIGNAVVTFIGGVGAGFSVSSRGTRLLQEINDGCSKPTKGKPACIQAMANLILAEPSHVGAAQALKLLRDYIEAGQVGFNDIKIDYRSEMDDAIRLGGFAKPEDGLSELARRRSHFHRPLPARTFSTIHKSKGLECPNVMVIPCDNKFSGTEYSRCRLYVALSRASHTLTLVVPSSDGSPLLKIE